MAQRIIPVFAFALLLPLSASAQSVGVEATVEVAPPAVQAAPAPVPPPPQAAPVPYAPYPQYAPYYAPPPQPRPVRPPGGYMPEWALLGPGLGMFVSTYGGAVLAAVMYGSGGEVDWLYAPIVGPFVLAAESSGDGTALFTLLGICQAGGLALLIAGLAINRRAGEPAVAAVPLLGPDLAGVAAAGRF